MKGPIALDQREVRGEDVIGGLQNLLDLDSGRLAEEP